MALSEELISQFVQATMDKTEPPKESTVYATVMNVEGKIYIRIDGSDRLTPVDSTVSVKDGERVTVMVKDHSAIITGNMSTPSASSKDLDDAKNQILEVNTLLADKVDVKELLAEKARIDELVAENVTIKGELQASSADISDLKADNAEIRGTLEANYASIKKLETETLTAEQADLKYATVENLEATNADIHNLNVTYGQFVVLSTEKFEAFEADIQELETKKLTAEQADLKYANIDFTNIGKAALEYIFAQSGLIKDVIIDNGTITGHLVGVTISGDLIEGNTIVAEKLVIKGDNGLYYKLNTDGVTTSTEQTDYNSLNGQVIKAKSVTAEKVNVSDLVAFGATIGGFHITDKSLYSGVKESINNTTRGVYLDSEGQMSIGDSINYLRYYQDENGNYKLDISLGAAGRVDEAITEATDSAHDAQNRIGAAELVIQMLNNCLSTLISDENGASLMTQTPDGGWTFSLAGTQQAIDEASQGLSDLRGQVETTDQAVNALNEAVNKLGMFNDYIKITSFEGEPCIELGEYDSDFKVMITNTRILFREGASTPTHIRNNTLVTEKIEVKSELSQPYIKDETAYGSFVWTVRQNGNYGLMWRGV